MVCAGVRAQTVASPGGETSFDFALKDGVPQAKVWRAGRLDGASEIGYTIHINFTVSAGKQRIMKGRLL